jgi:hypothetical protein
MKLKEVDLEIVTEYDYYNQVPQTSEIQWSMLNRLPGKDKFKELHTKVLCREYFGDVVVCANLDIDVPEIYGFKLKDKRASVKETLLSVSMSAAKIPSFLNHFKILRRIEKQMGIKMTHRYRTQHNDDNYTKLVLVGDKKWMSSPLLISIYTQLIRSFTYNTPSDSLASHIKALIAPGASGNDVNAFRKFKDSKLDLVHLLTNIDKVLDKKPLTGVDDKQLIQRKEDISTQCSCVTLKYTSRADFNSVVSWSIYDNHSNHGIVSFCENLRSREVGGEEVKYAENRIGTSWTDNYAALRKAEKEQIANPVVQPIPADNLEVPNEEQINVWDDFELAA